MKKQWIRYVVEPGMRILKGNQTSAYVKELLYYESLSWDEKEKIQKEKLGHFLEKAYQSTDYYQNRISPEDQTNLSTYPLLSKDEIIEHTQQLTNAKEKDAIPNSTGGTSGKVLRFIMSRVSPMYYEAARRIGLLRIGIQVGDPKVVFWGNIKDNEAGLKQKLRHHLLMNEIYISAYDLHPNQVEQYVSQINKFRPVYYYGYPSIMVTFFKMADEMGLKIEHSPKAMVVTAEKLDEHHKEYLERRLQCKVFNEYGARDAGIIGYECKEGHVHLFSSLLYTEVLDPETQKPVSEGELGELVVTDMTNTAMPKIRYILGDLVRKKVLACTCGVEGEVITEVQGRVGDILIGSQGELVHGQYFSKLLRSYPNMDEYQLIQKSREEVQVLIKSYDGDDNNKKNLSLTEIQEIQTKIQQKLGIAKVHIEQVKHIEKGPSGKYRPIKREFDFLP